MPQKPRNHTQQFSIHHLGKGDIVGWSYITRPLKDTRGPHSLFPGNPTHIVSGHFPEFLQSPASSQMPHESVCQCFYCWVTKLNSSKQSFLTKIWKTGSYKLYFGSLSYSLSQENGALVKYLKLEDQVLFCVFSFKEFLGPQV